MDHKFLSFKFCRHYLDISIFTFPFYANYYMREKEIFTTIYNRINSTLFLTCLNTGRWFVSVIANSLHLDFQVHFKISLITICVCVYISSSMHQIFPLPYYVCLIKINFVLLIVTCQAYYLASGLHIANTSHWDLGAEPPQQPKTSRSSFINLIYFIRGPETILLISRHVYYST